MFSELLDSSSYDDDQLNIKYIRIKLGRTGGARSLPGDVYLKNDPGSHAHAWNSSSPVSTCAVNNLLALKLEYELIAVKAWIR